MLDAYEHRGQGCVVLEANAKGADGRSIIRHRGVEILRTIPGNIVGRGSAAPEKRVTGNLPPNPHYIDTITSSSKIGDCLTPLSKNITAEQAAVFSRVGEFVTNIHNNLSTARAQAAYACRSCRECNRFAPLQSYLHAHLERISLPEAGSKLNLLPPSLYLKTLMYTA